MKKHNNIRKNTSREKAWKLMRSMGSYTLSEIATLAEADVENIRHYHLCLVAAGYVRQTGTRRQEGRGGVDKVFRLIKNTGPKPPVQKELRFLFDQNTGEYWADDPEKVADSIGNGAIHPVPIEGLTGKIKLGCGIKLLCPRNPKVAATNPAPAKKVTHVA